MLSSAEKYLLSMVKRYQLSYPQKMAQFRQTKQTKQTSNTMHRPANQSLPMLPSAKIYNMRSFKENNEPNLLEKVRDHLEMKRKENHLPTCNN